ncbi:hypothetical protein K1719_025586 [Acacia pycnantha]|nr:hypothetical protein K1719_025586 [Acacia pycnantha]
MEQVGGFMYMYVHIQLISPIPIVDLSNVWGQVKPETNSNVKQYIVACDQVTDIDYNYQSVFISDPENCLPKQLLKLNQSSISPFQFTSFPLELNPSETYLFSCPPNEFSCPYVAVRDYAARTLLDSGLISCTRMFNTFSSVSSSSDPNVWTLQWFKPNCGECEARGKLCKLNNNGTEDAIQCYEPPPKPVSKIYYAAIGVPVGSAVLVLVFFAFFKIYHYFRIKGEDLARVEKFLQDYRAFRPTRFSYADIYRITNHLKDKLGEGTHGAVFKGKVSKEISVAVKILNSMEGDGTEFINEVGTMAKIHHVNVARMLGFCADGLHRALVYDFFPNGSLRNYINPPDNENFLGWERLHHIALGIAKGVEYLHYGCDDRILHFDINPSNVLLDDNFVPKIIDFGLAKLCSKNQNTVSITAAKGTLGYIAPEVLSRNFGNVSYKSDIYSFGMLLLEMIGGRKNMDISAEGTCEILYPGWVYNLLEGRDVHIHIEEGDNKIIKKLATIGLWCIQWNPINRPSMKTVVQMLEGDEDNLTIPPDLFGSTCFTSSNPIIPARFKHLELEAIRE